MIVRIGMGFFALWGVAGVVILIVDFKDAADLLFLIPAALFTGALLYGAIKGHFPDIPAERERGAPAQE